MTGQQPPKPCSWHAAFIEHVQERADPVAVALLCCRERLFWSLLADVPPGKPEDSEPSCMDYRTDILARCPAAERFIVHAPVWSVAIRRTEAFKTLLEQLGDGFELLDIPADVVETLSSLRGG